MRELHEPALTTAGLSHDTPCEHGSYADLSRVAHL